MNVVNPANWSLTDRITALVAFFDVFDLPLTVEFIQTYLFGERIDSLTLLKADIFANGCLETLDDKVFLKGRSAIVDDLENRIILFQKLLDKGLKCSWLFRHIPFTEFVSVCNYLPFGIVETGSDIDLFIVTKKGRIFLARTLVTIFTHLAGIRRHGKKTEGRFCLSFYVHEEALDLQPILLDQNDFYMVFWLTGMKPLYAEAVSMDKILADNQWLNQYMKSIDRRSFGAVVGNIGGKSFVKRSLELAFNGKVGEWIEKALGNFFIKRHLKRKGELPVTASVEVSDKRLKFHNNDRRAFYRDEFFARLKRLGLLQ